MTHASLPRPEPILTRTLTLSDGTSFAIHAPGSMMPATLRFYTRWFAQLGLTITN